MAQSTEAGIKVGSVRGTNNSTSFGIVYHLGDKAGKKKEEEKAKALEEDARLRAAAKAKEEAMAKAANELVQAKQKAEQYAINYQTIVLYLTNKWELVESSVKKLQPMLAILTENPDLKIQIDGHSDNFGTTENNQKVSKYRADGVANFFKSQGVKSNRMKLKAYGETKPAASNQTQAGMALNRRVEIRVIK